MTWLKNLNSGLNSLFDKSRVNRELDEELEAYLEASVADKTNAGMSTKAALKAAHAEMGSQATVKHQVWTSRWESVPDNILQDLRFAFRQLTKTPGFTLVALLSLALGIGANTAIFTLLNAVLLRPLPVPQPERLVLFGEGKQVGSTSGLPNGTVQLVSYPFYKAFTKDFTAQTSLFSGLAAVSSIQFGSHISVAGGEAERIHIDLVSGSYFNVLGVPAALGRTLSASDETAPGANPVAVISYAWFQRRLQGNPAALGQSLRIQGHDFTIIGVASAGFEGHAPGQPADFWIPLTMEKEISPGWNGLGDKEFQSLYILGRLAPGATMDKASAPTNLLFRNIIRSEFLSSAPSAHDLDDLAHARIDLTSFAAGLPGLRRLFSGPLEILMGLVILVLLIACANIANMLLARGVARIRELAVRQALGATRARIVTQLLTESLLLSLAGASLGILFAWRGCRLLLALGTPSTDALPLNISPDYRVLGFTLGVTLFTALLFGIAPAMRSTRLALIPALKEGRGSSSAHTRSTLSRGLIVGQITLSLLLLTAAGLFLRSLANLTHVDLGFNPRNVTVFNLDEEAANLPAPSGKDTRLIQLQQQIERTVQSQPGVQSASFSMFTFNQGEWSDGITMQDVPRTKENNRDVLFNTIGVDYLKTFAIPILAGRNFNPQDTATSPHVALVNETLARTFVPNGSALGRHFCLCDENPNQPLDIEIVGIVRDAHYVGLGESRQMAVYFPYSQHPQYFGNLSVRTTLSRAALVPAVRRAIAAVNPNIAINHIESLEDEVTGSIATERLIGLLSTFFAVLAVFLAAIGIYGLISYSVVRRTNEIGIRLALGSQTRALLWLIFRESLVLLAVGLVVGLPVAFAIAHALTAFLKTQLFQVDTLDPITFCSAIAVISGMTVLAAWLPARRATKVDPMVDLRCD